MYLESPGILAASVAPSGTVAISLPTGYDVGRVQGGIGHVLVINQGTLLSPRDFSVALAGTTATITNRTAGTWAQGSPFILQLNQPGDAAKTIAPSRVTDKVVGTALVRLVNIGAPATASATAVLSAVAVAAANVNVLPAVFIVPGGCAGRALTIKSSTTDTTQSITIVGKDIFGVTITQTLALNGTTAVNGTKAFATVTSVTANIALAGNLSVGTIDVFGLPVPVNMLGLVVKDLTDGATSGTAGTFVVADQTAGGPSATSGDARGTYAPNTASNGTHYYHVLLIAPDAGFAGIQF